jgi:hypothetical protein
MGSNELPTVYLTKEQLQRLAGLACDALIGIQIHTDASDQTDAIFEFVHVDHPHNDMEYGVVEADGTWHRTT